MARVLIDMSHQPFLEKQQSRSHGNAGDDDLTCQIDDLGAYRQSRRRPRAATVAPLIAFLSVILGSASLAVVMLAKSPVLPASSPDWRRTDTLVVLGDSYSSSVPWTDRHSLADWDTAPVWTLSVRPRVFAQATYTF